LHDADYARLDRYEQRHPIVVTGSTRRLEVTPLPRRAGLDPDARLEVARFLRKYKERGEGPIVVSLPRGDSNAGAAVPSIRYLTRMAGIDERRLRVGSHRRSAGPNVELSYGGFDAVPPECGDWSEDVSDNRENMRYPNFGCATQRNLAAMVSHPTDLEIPAPETPRSSERRAKVWKKYVDGELGRDGQEDRGAAVNTRQQN
jgi:pilus assembly protein CpaD